MSDLPSLMNFLNGGSAMFHRLTRTGGGSVLRAERVGGHHGYPRIAPEKKLQAAELIRQGQTKAKIAVAVGMSEASVAEIARKLGVVMIDGRVGGGMAPENRARAAELIRQGITKTEVSRRAGISLTGVTTIARELGVDMPDGRFAGRIPIGKKERAGALMRQGASKTEVSRQAGISIGSVTAIAKKLGVELPDGRTLRIHSPHRKSRKAAPSPTP